jgi:hypothetical protein
MNPLVIALAISGGLVVGAAGLTLFLLWRAHALLRTLKERAAHREQENKELAAHLIALSARIQELERAPASAALVPTIPRAGMNLNKRSQALRLHRQREQPEQIAAALELPQQEVELLIKVHQIVMANV